VVPTTRPARIAATKAASSKLGGASPDTSTRLRRRGGDLAEQVGVAVRGAGAHFAVAQQREPVLAQRVIAGHRRPVEQLHRVEIDVARARRGIARDEHRVGRNGERHVGLEAVADRQVLEEALRVAAAARVVELVRCGRRRARAPRRSPAGGDALRSGSRPLRYSVGR
jgi:hypothetical protein